MAYDIINDTAAQNAIANSPDWRSAVDELITYLCEGGHPFSSGEIAALLRTHRPDLRFAVTRVGDHVRDSFYCGAIEYLDEYGDANKAVQVPRVTQGLGRTPAGIQVFVYAPDQQEGEDHHFEVDIPVPGGDGVQAAPTPAATQPPPPAKPQAKVKAGIHGVPSGIDLRATVHIDGRVCVTRAAFEELVHAAGQPVPYGTPVFVRFDSTGGEARISLDPAAGGDKHELTRRGRILFPRPGDSLTPSSVYKVSVDEDEAELVVDLSRDLKTTVG